MDSRTINKLALDIGNSKIKFIYGELSIDGTKLRVIDYIERDSQGLRKSVVEDQEALETAIRETLIEIEGRNRRNFDRVSVGVSNDHIFSKTEHSYIEFEEKEINATDMETLVKNVVDRVVDIDEFVIEKEIYNIRVDNSSILKSAIGQKGRSIQADVHLITMKRQDIHILESIINRVGLEIEDLYLSVSSAAKAILTEEEKQIGVALVDIGEGLTDIAIYKNNKIIYTKSLSIGGMHYINDLVYLLGISKVEAKEILFKLENKEYSLNYIETLNGKYELSKINEIIDARTDDFIRFISKTIEDSGFNGYLGKGLVLTGGVSSLSNIFNKVGMLIGCSVKQGVPFQLRGLENPSPAMSVVIGTLLTKLEIEFKKENYVSAHNLRDETYIENGEYEDELKELDIKLDSSSFLQEDFEDDDLTIEEEIEREKAGKMEKIKRWFHNLIN